MKKLMLMGLVLLFTFSPSPPKRKKQEQQHRIYYNTMNYKYDDDEIISRNSR